MVIDWEQRALQAEETLAKCLDEIKKYREIFSHIKYQLFIAEGIELKQKQDDGLDKYRYTYP